ncbi:MAG: hypothetical protein WD557_04180 [Dehalococcoidia bacterium]
MTRNPARNIVLALLVLGVFALAGCTDEGEQPTASERPTPTESPTGTGTLHPTICPAEPSVCEFSLEVSEAVGRADFDALRAMMQLAPFTCPGATPGGLGGPYPLCDGAAAGEVREGMHVYRLGSHGTTVREPLSEVRTAVLSNWQFPELANAAQPRIVGLHCPIADAGGDCGERFVLFLAGAPHFEITRNAASYVVTALQFNHFAPDESVFENGGEFAMAGASGTRDARFYPWRPGEAGRDADAVKEGWLMAPADISGVVVEPHEGSCPATVTLSVPEAALVQDPKGPEIVEVDLFDGPLPVDYQTSERSRPREKVRAIGGAAEHEFEIRIDSSMLQGEMCSAGVIGMAVHGSTGPKIAGYRIVP